MAGSYMESRIGRIAVKAQSAWGTAESVPIADTGTVECELTMPTIEQEALVQESLKGNFHADTVVAGAKRATLSLSMVLHGWSSSTPTDNPDTLSTNPEMLLLKSALGGLVTTGYTATVTPGSSTAAVPTNSALSAAWIGNAQLYDLGSSDYSVGWVKNSTGTDVTLIRDLAGVPSGTTAFGSAVAYLTKAPVSPLTIFYQGPDVTGASGNGATLRLSDCVVTSATITANPKEQPKLTCEISAGAWDITGSGLAAQFTYSYTQLNPLLGVNGARFVTAGGEMALFSAEITIENTVAEVNSLASSQGLAEFVSTNRVVTGSLMLPADNSFSLYSPGQALGVVQMDLASSPGQSFSILFPSATVSEMQTISDQDGIIAKSSNVVVSKYEADAASDEAGNKPFRVAWL